MISLITLLQKRSYTRNRKEAKARKRHCVQCKKDEKKRLLVVEGKTVYGVLTAVLHCANILAFFSITANFNNTGTFLLNYFVYIVKILLSDIMYF